MPTEPNLHDGWTPEPQEQVQPGDPWRDPSPDPVSEVREVVEAAHPEPSIKDDSRSEPTFWRGVHVGREQVYAALTQAGPEERGEGLTGDNDDLMQRLATEGDPRFADTAGRAYIRIRTLQAALSAATSAPDTGAEERLLDTSYHRRRVARKRGEYVWLIERGQPEGLTRPQWWGVTDSRTGAYGWSDSAFAADRFATRHEAEAVIAQFNSRPGHPFNARAVEHGFHPESVAVALTDTGAEERLRAALAHFEEALERHKAGRPTGVSSSLLEGLTILRAVLSGVSVDEEARTDGWVVCGIDGCDFAVERGEGRTMALHQSEDHSR